jgi:hypothetical protein
MSKMLRDYALNKRVLNKVVPRFIRPLVLPFYFGGKNEREF